MKIELRDYQAYAFQQAREAVRQGKRRILIVAPTGGGKTVLASALMEMVKEKGKRASFVVDRLSLVQQTSDTFDRYGLDHGVIQGGHFRFRPSLPLQLCSVQTLGRRMWPETQVDVFDEAHVLHATHKKRLESGASIVIGLTATPFTKGLGKWFDTVINVTTTRALIEQNWLSSYRVFSCVEPDMSGVTVKSTGEWDDTQASKKALEVVGDVVAEYLKHGENRKFICSAVDTAHVQELQRQFLAAGINVASYTYLDSEEDRCDVTLEFRKADSAIKGLITVTAASRGFDIPDVSCIIMARPLRKSLAEHIQLLGRGLRIAEGKNDCLVLCHSGNMARFWVDTEDFFDNGLDELDDGEAKDKKKPEKKPEAEPVKCQACGHLHKPMPFCPACGHEYPKRVTVQHVPGTLKELIATKDAGMLRRELWPQVCWYVRERCNPRDDLHAQKMAQGIYASLVGEPAKARYENTTPKECSREVADKIRGQHNNWLIRQRYGRAKSASRPMPDNWGETRGGAAA
jgi:superfamily II DNA or RNA helicase